MITLYPDVREGGEVVGSGKPEIACPRMHSDTWRICAITCADVGPEPGPPLGSRCLDDDWAEWNAGDWRSTPEPLTIRIWPLL